MSAMLSAGIARNPSTPRFRSTRDDAKLAILRHANSGSTAKNERAARFGDPHPFIRRALGRRAPMPFSKMHLICESEKRRFLASNPSSGTNQRLFFGPLWMLRRKTPGRQTPHWKPNCQIVPELGLLARKRRFANMTRRTHPSSPNPSTTRAPPAPSPLRPQAFRARPPAGRPTPARSRNPSRSHIPS